MKLSHQLTVLKPKTRAPPPQKKKYCLLVEGSYMHESDDFDVVSSDYSGHLCTIIECTGRFCAHSLQISQEHIY